MKNSSYNVYTLTFILCALSLSCASYATNRRFRRMRTTVKNLFEKEKTIFESTVSVQQAEISFHEMENLSFQLISLYTEDTYKQKWQSIYNNLNQQWTDKRANLRASKEYQENKFNELKNEIKNTESTKTSLFLSVQQVLLANQIAKLCEEQTEKRDWTDCHDRMRESLLRTYDNHYVNWNRNDANFGRYLLYYINTMWQLLYEKNLNAWKDHRNVIKIIVISLTRR